MRRDHEQLVESLRHELSQSELEEIARAIVGGDDEFESASFYAGYVMGRYDLAHGNDFDPEAACEASKAI
jgi:hypothetical protein